MARKYKQCVFKPQNKEKYIGDINNIYLRSGWEISVARWLDINPNVLNWSSEECVIPYICETDNKQHRYFVDFTATIQDLNGKITKYLIEVKPFTQTQPPKEPKRKTKYYYESIRTYLKNQSKWKYARAYCDRMGYKFLILTENEIYGNKKGK